MNNIGVKDQQRVRRERDAARRRRRLRPTLTMLEDRRLLSNFIVNNPTDAHVDGQTDLREAIAQAASDTTNDTITFDSTAFNNFNTPQTITLGGSQLEITKAFGTLSIQGPGANLLSVSGNSDFTKFSRVFQVDANVTASISGLTITGGDAGYGGGDGYGGGLINHGTATLTNCTISGNSAFIGPTGGGGGGLENDGTATLTNCTVSDNRAADGGGLGNKGTLTLTACTVSGNDGGFLGGGLYNKGTLTLTACTVSGNSAQDGGGLCNNGGTLTLTACTVSGNTAGFFGGGLYNLLNGTATLTNCTLSSNTADLSGGALSNGSADAGPGGALTLTNCTVSGNTATDRSGGGLANYGSTLTLTNCTVSGNSAPYSGGGLYNSMFTNSTDALTNTIVAGNSTSPGGSIPSDVGNPSGSVSGSYNLIGTGAVSGSNITGVTDPELAPLGDYGGPTQTMALLPGSPAIGTGTTADYPDTNTPITTDQRGLPLDSPSPDIGAFQTNPLVVNTTIDGTGSPSGDLSLRQAVNLANALGGTETITFDPTVFSTPRTIILNGSQLELTGTTAPTTITGPAAGVTVSGGGSSRVFQVDSGVTASISGLTITDGNAGSNSGGGLYNAGALTLTNCTVSGNRATYDGGGLANGGINTANATATLTNCTVSGNSASDGGGLANSGTLTLTNCTASGNSASNGGGGLANSGTLTLTNCTVSGNSASNGGGGLAGFFGSTATLTNCTVSGNSAGFGGGLIDTNDTATLTNTIVAGNTGDDIFGSASGNYNLIGIGAVSGSNNITGVTNPGLAQLGDYGGPTQTMALVPGSPALDAGSNAAVTNPPFPGTSPFADQRGFLRISGGTVDIGAFENQVPILSPTTLPAGVVDSPYSQTIAATATGGAKKPFTFAITTGALPPGLSLVSLNPTTAALSGTPTATGTFTFTVLATDSNADTGSQAYTLTINPPLDIIAPALPNGTYGTAYGPAVIATVTGGTAPYTFSTGALPPGLSLVSLNPTTAALSGTPTSTGTFTITVTATDSDGATASASTALTINPATLTATGGSVFNATAGAPLSNVTVATFTNADPFGSASSYTALISWGDGSASTGVITGTSTFTVTGSHTYASASPSSETIAVTISHNLGYTTTATVYDTANVTSLGQGVVHGLTGGIGFWHNMNGQVLINRFNGGSTATALSAWLVATFPNLYGTSAGGNNLTGDTNAQVAAYYQTLFNLGGTQVQAQVLATALNVYATTSSLGGTAGVAYGFTVSDTGLGARSYNVGKDGAAFGVANNTTLNVYQLLVAVNNQAANGVLYSGNPKQTTLQAQAADLFNSLNKAGTIG